MSQKTRRSWIYQIREQLQLTSPDSVVSNRMISSRLESVLDLLIRRDSDTRKTWKQTNLFVTKPITLKSLSETRSRSTIPVPAAYMTNTGLYLQVLNTETGAVYMPSTPLQQAGQTGNYYWLENNFLVIGQGRPGTLSVHYYPKPVKTEPCQSELDVVLSVPDHLDSDLLTSVLQELIKAPASIPPDTYPNGNQLDKQGPRPGSN